MCDPQHYGHSALRWPMVPGPFALFDHDLSLQFVFVRLWFVVQLPIHNRIIEQLSFFIELFIQLTIYTHMPGTDDKHN